MSFDIAARFGDNLVRVRKRSRLDTLVKLAASLEVDAAQLLTGIEWRHGETRTGRFREG